MKLVYYTAPENTTNAIFLLGAFLVSRLSASPEQAWEPFSRFSAMVTPYRDATWCRSTFDLTLLHCFQALHKAIKTGLYDPNDFDQDEYLYYDNPANGDLHEVVPVC